MQPVDPYRPNHSTYSPEQQEAILTLASRLQHQARQEATLGDLERAASEAGIDPRYVREAAGMIERDYPVGLPVVRKSSLDRWVAARGLIAISLFLPAQFLVTTAMLQPWRGSAPALVGLLLGLVLPLMAPRGKEWRWAPAAVSLGGATFSYIACHMYHAWYLAYGDSIIPLFEVVLAQCVISYFVHSSREKFTLTRRVASRA